MIRKNGEATAAFLVGAPALLLIFFGTLQLFFYLGLRSTLNLDSFMLARAHLYGHNLQSCNPNQFWPAEQNLIRLSFHCRAPAEVSAHLYFEKTQLSRSHWNLSP